MARCLAQTSVFIGIIGTVFSIVILAVDNWQVADPDVKVGLWRRCDETGCGNLEKDGYSNRQWNSLWACRVLLILSVLMSWFSMWVGSLVMYAKGSRKLVLWAVWIYWVVAFIQMLVMSLYVDQLKDPADDQSWDYPLALIILNWLLIYPIAGVVLKCVTSYNRYKDQASIERDRRERQQTTAHINTGSAPVSPQFTNMSAAEKQGHGSPEQQSNQGPKRGGWVDGDHRAIRPVPGSGDAAGR